jgi:hypothetical protein
LKLEAAAETWLPLFFWIKISAFLDIAMSAFGT